MSTANNADDSKNKNQTNKELDILDFELDIDPNFADNIPELAHSSLDTTSQPPKSKESSPSLSLELDMDSQDQALSTSTTPPPVPSSMLSSSMPDINESNLTLQSETTNPSSFSEQPVQELSLEINSDDVSHNQEANNLTSPPPFNPDMLQQQGNQTQNTQHHQDSNQQSQHAFANQEFINQQQNSASLSAQNQNFPSQQPLSEHNQFSHNREQPPAKEQDFSQGANPYAAPNMGNMNQNLFEEMDDGHFGLLEEPRKNEAGRGVTWLVEAFTILKDNWILWILMGLAMILIYTVLGMIPILGFLVNIVVFHFTAGFMVAAAEQEEGYDIGVSALFSPLQTHLAPLLILFGVYFLLTIIVMIPMIIIMGGALMSVTGALGSDITAMNDAMTGGASLVIILGVLVSVSFFIPVIMSIYHAPALIVLHDVTAVQAMKMSFKGCWKNILPFLLFGLVMSLSFIVGTVVTLGLGLLILFPLMMISYYTSYRDIWSGRMIDDY